MEHQTQPCFWFLGLKFIIGHSFGVQFDNFVYTFWKHFCQVVKVMRSTLPHVTNVVYLDPVGDQLDPSGIYVWRIWSLAWSCFQAHIQRASPAVYIFIFTIQSASVLSSRYQFRLGDWLIIDYTGNPYEIYWHSPGGGKLASRFIHSCDVTCVVCNPLCWRGMDFAS